MSGDPAKARFIALQAIRWTGVMLAVFGLLILNGKFDLPYEAGAVIFIVGLFDALFMPIILARRWKSPPK